jgi:hypothetical protein
VHWGCYDATALDIEVDPQRCCLGSCQSDFALPVCLLLQDLVQSCLLFITAVPNTKLCACLHKHPPKVREFSFLKRSPIPKCICLAKISAASAESPKQFVLLHGRADASLEKSCSAQCCERWWCCARSHPWCHLCLEACYSPGPLRHRRVLPLIWEFGLLFRHMQQGLHAREEWSLCGGARECSAGRALHAPLLVCGRVCTARI